MTHPDDEQRVVPVKSLMWAAGAFTSGLGVSMVLFSQIILPAIMRDVMIESRTAMEKHEQTTHRGSVSRAEFDMLRDTMKSQTDQILTNIRAMSDKIDRLHAN